MLFRVLGPLEVIDDDGADVAVVGSKERVILAALLLQPGEVVSSDRLIEILWADELPANPENALQARVSALRRSLGKAGVVITQSPGYRLAVERDEVDAARFEQLLAAARGEADRGSPTAEAAYRDALTLWRGPPYVEFTYQDFAQAEIARLEELRVAALEGWVQSMLDSGHHHEAVGELERLVVDHPLRERFWGQLMLARYRSGRQADALRAFREASRILGEELGIDPSPELRRLEEAILLQDQSLEAPPRHLGNGESHLPARLASLVGRDDDAAGLVSLLGEHRLITLTGPGGVGKTSLALAGAEAWAPRCREGAWLVELASATHGDVAPVLARALRLNTADRPTLDALADALRHRELLIVLDNCEHVIDEAAEAVVAILSHGAGIRVIATSREPLGVPGEILWPTRPLTVPAEAVDDAPTVGGFDAVRLFVDRARAVDPSFTLDAGNAAAVADICRRLDGLPLAIELAAARVRAMAVHEIASRLDDRFRLLTSPTRTLLPRQQTLEAAIAWSHDLLTAPQQQLFRRLSVFAGGWTITAVEAVAPGLDDPFDLLTALVDRSLVTIDRTDTGARYGMLETIRAFAARELAASGEESDAALGHARWFLSLAQAAQWRGPEQSRWVDRLGREHDNLRVAIEHALGHGDSDTALGVAAAMAWPWFFGNREEGRSVLDRVLAATTGHSGTRRVAALHGRALLDLFDAAPPGVAAGEESLRLADTLDDPSLAAYSRVFAALEGVTGAPADRSLLLLDEALDAFADLGDEWGLGLARFQRMEVLAHRGDLHGAVAEGETALQWFRDTGDPWAVSATLAHLGRYGRLTGRTEAAAAASEEAAALAREQGLIHTLQFVLTDQGALHAAAGDHGEARRILAEALELAEAVGNPIGAAMIAAALAESFLATGDLDEAARLHGDAHDRFGAIDLDVGRAHALAGLGRVAEARSDWEEALRHHLESVRLVASPSRVVDSIPGLEGLGRTAAAAGDSARASRLLAAAAELRRRTGLSPSAFEAAATAAAVAGVASSLGAEVVGAMTADAEAAPVDALLDPA
jgi:predicted ATPase/DNA-binding SARP family transcriptional activator